MNILKETGGNLAETFQTIVTTVRERQKVEKKIQALTAQGTMQAVIISLVPFLLLGMFLVVDPQLCDAALHQAFRMGCPGHYADPANYWFSRHEKDCYH